MLTGVEMCSAGGRPGSMTDRCPAAATGWAGSRTSAAHAAAMTARVRKRGERSVHVIFCPFARGSGEQREQVAVAAVGRDLEPADGLLGAGGSCGQRGPVL